MSKIDGIYAMYFTGKFGSNIGILLLKDGIITGADEGNVCYDGKYVERGDGSVKIDIKLEYPPETTLVTGVSIGQEPQTDQLPTMIFPPGLGEGKVIQINARGGPVNIMFRKLRSFP